MALDARVDGLFLIMFANLRDKLTSSFRGGGVTKEDTLLIERAKEIIDKKIRVDGKSSLRYEDVQAKLVLEFSKRSFEKHRVEVEKLLAAATLTRARVKSNSTQSIQIMLGEEAEIVDDAKRPVRDRAPARPRPSHSSVYGDDIRRISTTDVSTLRHDLYGAMARTYDDNEMAVLSKALHSSWPTKASDLKKQSKEDAASHNRGGVLTAQEGRAEQNLKAVLAHARKDPRVQAEIDLRRASTYGTPGSTLNGLNGATTLPRQHEALASAKLASAKLTFDTDSTGKFAIPISPPSDAATQQPAKQRPRTGSLRGTSSTAPSAPLAHAIALGSISERASRLHQISFLKRKGVISDMQKSVAKELLLRGDVGIIRALQNAEGDPLKLVSYLALRMGQPGVEAIAHYQSTLRRIHEGSGVGSAGSAPEQLVEKSKAKRRRDSKEGTVGTKLQPRKWSPEEDAILLRAVNALGAKNWKAIAEIVPDRNHVQCLQRYKKVLKPGLVRGGWTVAEDALLERLVRDEQQKLGVVIANETAPVAVRAAWMNNWRGVSEQIEGRTPKQCRERWINHLDPSIKKGNWEPEEDEIILKTQNTLGNKWSMISKLCVGRTENAVKIRFKSLMRAEAKEKRGDRSSVNITSMPIEVDSIPLDESAAIDDMIMDGADEAMIMGAEEPFLAGERRSSSEGATKLVAKHNRRSSWQDILLMDEGLGYEGMGLDLGGSPSRNRSWDLPASSDDGRGSEATDEKVVLRNSFLINGDRGAETMDVDFNHVFDDDDEI